MHAEIGMGRGPRRRVRGGVGALLLAAILFGGALLAACASVTGAPTLAAPAATPSATPASPSPLLYGTNMALFDAHDQLATGAAAQQALRQRGMAIIRMPFRRNLTDAVEVQALRAIKAIGAAPLVIVHGAMDATALADDKRLIGLAQSVFGSETVYVEFGNEEDLAGVDVARYTAAWNAVIPALKALAPTYKFVGPVNFQYDPAYVAAFDKGAAPRPDFNSWHEYVCNTGNDNAYCLAHIARWTVHAQLTNDAVRAAIGTTIPYMITEWNLDPQQDPRYADAGFMRQWTTAALQTLAANAADGLFAAMQYCATNNAGFNLLDGANAPTAEGQALFEQLAAANGGTPAPSPPATPAATLAATLATTATAGRGTATPGASALRFSFEDGGTDGWKAHGGQIAGVANAGGVAADGARSLAVSLRGLTSGTYPYVAVDVRTARAAGGRLDLAIYVPRGAGAILARPFAMSAAYQWMGTDRYARLSPGWNHVSYALPSSFTGSVAQLGVQLMAAPGAAFSGTIAIDAVDWR